MWGRLIQILGLLLCILGWSFVGCTFAMGQWRVAQLGGQGGSSVVATAWFWSDLWRDCYEDSGGVVNCVDVWWLWSVKSHIHAVRGLLTVGLCLGVVSTALTFFGLECTHLGGDERSKDRMLFTASALHLLGGASAVAAYCLYINRVVAAFLHSKADPSKVRYETGVAVYAGLVGSFLVLLGCTLHCAAVCTVNYLRRHPAVPSCEKEDGTKVWSGRKRRRGSPKTPDNRRNVFPYRMASVVTV